MLLMPWLLSSSISFASVFSYTAKEDLFLIYPLFNQGTQEIIKDTCSFSSLKKGETCIVETPGGVYDFKVCAYLQDSQCLSPSLKDAEVFMSAPVGSWEDIPEELENISSASQSYVLKIDDDGKRKILLLKEGVFPLDTSLGVRNVQGVFSYPESISMGEIGGHGMPQMSLEFKDFHLSVPPSLVTYSFNGSEINTLKEVKRSGEILGSYKGFTAKKILNTEGFWPEEATEDLVVEPGEKKVLTQEVNVFNKVVVKQGGVLILEPQQSSWAILGAKDLINEGVLKVRSKFQGPYVIQQPDRYGALNQKELKSPFTEFKELTQFSPGDALIQAHKIVSQDGLFEGRIYFKALEVEGKIKNQDKLEIASLKFLLESEKNENNFTAPVVEKERPGFKESLLFSLKYVFVWIFITLWVVIYAKKTKFFPLTESFIGFFILLAMLTLFKEVDLSWLSLLFMETLGFGLRYLKKVPLVKQYLGIPDLSFKDDVFLVGIRWVGLGFMFLSSIPFGVVLVYLALYSFARYKDKESLVELFYDP